ncbi:branched-chain amino acid ABC transporter permease [Streptomyces sp. H23]|uniref:branched-chain amino acid ABC transporter permease n=1 Tax=Streptomyces sp. H23 TaxID=2541723 RepID=UPI00106DD39E|nr:branched-chain amino acid ABC transporter permease [Streptomyces sp. H23]
MTALTARQRSVIVAAAGSAAGLGITYPLVFLPGALALGLGWLLGYLAGTMAGGGRRLAATAALAPPAIAAPAFMPLLDVTQVLILGIAVLGLNVIVGWAGELNLAQGTVVGLGAYVSAILSVHHGWPILLTLPIAAALCGLVGLFLGLVALRFEGIFLAVLTMSFALILPIVLKHYDGLTGGTQGIIVPDAPLPGDQATGEYVLALVCVVLVVLLTYNVLRDAVGLALNAVRESPIAAAGSGVSASRVKITAFVFGSVLAGIAGALYAMTVGFVGPDSFGLFYGIQFLTMVVVGGVRSIAGSFLGALLIFQLNAHVSPIDLGSFVGADGLALSPQAVFALILIGVLIATRDGVVGLLTKAGRALPLPSAVSRKLPRDQASTLPEGTA